MTSNATYTDLGAPLPGSAPGAGERLVVLALVGAFIVTGLAIVGVL